MLKTMVSRMASDAFISAGFPPALKIEGKVTRIFDHVLSEIGALVSR